MVNKKITLSIETAVEGGSLSLLDGDSIIDRWVGEREVSRSEDLIEAISAILRRNQLKANDLDILSVSRGPGSYTGARIGLATAIGLKNALEIECFAASVLDSFNFKFGNQNLDVITAVSFGKNDVCYQIFEKFSVKCAMEKIPLKIKAFNDFINFYGEQDTVLVINQKLYTEIKNYLPNDTPNIINAGVFISDYTGGLVASNNGSDNLIPIYPGIF
jgi:tRNA threonylcarbamoyl adenosine modification protein YeaZ